MPTKEQYQKRISYYRAQSRAYSKKHRTGANREKYNAYQKEYYRKHPEKLRFFAWKGRLKAKYGITPEIYEALKTLQGGVCAICKRATKRRLAVDHDHATGMVRGLLCDSCNTKLGWYEKYRDLAELYVLKGYKSWNGPNKS